MQHACGSPRFAIVCVVDPVDRLVGRSEHLWTPLRPSTIRREACAPMEHWLYVDEGGEVQGPFDGDTMLYWHKEGHFPGTTLVKRTTDLHFHPLASLGDPFAQAGHAQEGRTSEEVPTTLDGLPCTGSEFGVAEQDSWHYTDDQGEIRG